MRVGFIARFFTWKDNRGAVKQVFTVHTSSANFNENDNKNIKTMNLGVNEHDILHKNHGNKGICIRLLVHVLEKLGLCNQTLILVADICFIHIICFLFLGWDMEIWFQTILHWFPVALRHYICYR